MAKSHNLNFTDMIHNGHTYKPILFKPEAEMVSAILDGRKTQTRRLHEKPKYKVGDRLWVREGYRIVLSASTDRLPYAVYEDGSSNMCKEYNVPLKAYTDSKIPSIHMPFGAHRIELEVTGVKQERLKDISINDAIAEGVEKVDGRYWKNYKGTTRAIANADWSFFSLWEKIHGLESFNSNPLVTAYTFKRIA